YVLSAVRRADRLRPGQGRLGELPLRAERREEDPRRPAPSLARRELPSRRPEEHREAPPGNGVTLHTRNSAKEDASQAGLIRPSAVEGSRYHARERNDLADLD